MKKFLVLLIFALASCSAPKMVGYSHKPLSTEGCGVSLYAMKKGDERFIVAQLTSDRFVFADSPLLKIRTFDGNVMVLNGVALASRTEHGAVISGSVIVPYTSLNAMAQFKIEDTQIEELTKGIQKIQLSTLPIVHEKKFRRDKIGKKLYELLMKASDDF